MTAEGQLFKLNSDLRVNVERLEGIRQRELELNEEIRYKLKELDLLYKESDQCSRNISSIVQETRELKQQEIQRQNGMEYQ